MDFGSKNNFIDSNFFITGFCFIEFKVLLGLVVWLAKVMVVVLVTVSHF
jgi:hypothetical protein